MTKKKKQAVGHSISYDTSPYNVFKRGGYAKPPKHFLGAVIGAASLGMNVFNTIKANKEAKLAREISKNQRNAQLLEEDRMIMEDYPTAGNEDILGFYGAKGGKIKSKEKRQDLSFSPNMIGEVEVKAPELFKVNPYPEVRMRPLWPSMVKKDRNAIVGTFDSFDPNFERGLTLDEMSKILPTELKEQYNIDTFKESLDNKKAKGGLMKLSGYNAKGGDLNPLSSDSEVAKGNTHNESRIDSTSGIKLLDANGIPVAEIEDGEVVKNDQLVFSDRLKTSRGRTYAKEAESLGREKGRLEKELVKGNVNGIRRSTIKAKLAKIDANENNLFKEQELSKSYGGKMAYGGKTKKMQEGGNVDLNPSPSFGDIAGQALPYVDNLVNAILTSRTPRPEFPLLARPRKLRTSFNVAPQLQDVTDTVNQITEGIRRGTASSTAAQERVTATRLAGARQKGQIRAQKENIETQLENQAIQNLQQTEAQNLARIQDYRDRMLSRSYNIQGRIAGNVADIVGDVNKAQQAKATEAYLDEQLNVIKETYDVGGTSDRADLDVFSRQVLARDRNGNYIYPDKAQRFLSMYPQYNQ